MAKPDIGLLIGVGKPPKAADPMGKPEPADEGKAMACQALRRALEGDDDVELMSAFKEMLEYANDDSGEVPGEDESIEVEG